MAVETSSTKVETPEKKQSFDWIYVQENPTAYKTEILDKRTYICDNNTRKEFDRLILPKVDLLLSQKAEDRAKLRITEVGCCYGNTTLALVHGMTTEQIRENWRSADTCEKIDVPRRIPTIVTGIDISEPALHYGKRSGIFDETIAANLNSEEGLSKVKLPLQGTDILICTAALVYLNPESVQSLVQDFAAGTGEGYVIINFLNPFELEKMDRMKQVFLKHLDFVGSTSAQHRTMSEKEKDNYGDYGDWVLLEIWVLRRRGSEQQMSPPAKFSPTPRVEMDATPEEKAGEDMDTQPGDSKWDAFTVERWRSAVYINLTYFADLYKDTINFITEIGKHMKLRGQRVSLVEVGCGTGELIRPIADDFRVAIGLDFNKAFIDFCNESIPKGKEGKMKFIDGDACELVNIMKEKAPEHIWSDTRIVTCVGNTIGIIPEHLKERVYHQMAELAGPDGVMVIVYWNSKWFGDACQNFYHANPQLCGPFDGDSVDFKTTTLSTPAPTSYRSHWTGIQEAREVLASLDLEEIIVEERGKGVLVAARKRQLNVAMAGAATTGIAASATRDTF